MMRLLNPARTFGAVCFLTLLAGYYLPLQQWLTPERGVGYALGIIGGSMMLLLALYPARKRMSVLTFMGGVPFWFRTHMVLGIVGPLLILFHSTFSLGAMNSNVALICMLLVSGSGIVGRYFYTRVYDQLLGRQATLEEVRERAELLHKQNSAVKVLPQLLATIDNEERRLLAASQGAWRAILHPLTAGIRAVLARRRLRTTIHHLVVLAARETPAIAPQAGRLYQVAYSYACRRLDAQRRVAEYRMYAGLFSGWHLFHVPLYFMLIMAGIVHVIAVNVY
jgi:hypothetical protein